VRLIGGLLIGLAVVFAAGGARADLIAGCCDSLTDPEYSNPGYLPLISQVYGEDNVIDQAVGARLTADSLSALADPTTGYLASADPEVVAVLAGTTDPYWLSGATLAATEANIANMVAASLADTDFSEAILVAPPPVLDPCVAAPSGWSCSAIDDFLRQLRDRLRDNVATYYDVPFVDLYSLFEDYLPYVELYASDGVHANGDGDLLIAQAMLDEYGPLVGGPCADGVNNDPLEDGLIDFDGGLSALGYVATAPDPQCDDQFDWSEGDVPVLECDDGIDNDADGAIDLNDFGCHSRGDFSERTALNEILCDDGVDNDGDGTIDYLGDPGCGTPLQMAENPACNDGLDNDGDGNIDFDGGDSLDLDPRDGFIDYEFNPDQPAVTAPDAYCSSASITREKRPAQGTVCGLGFEVALVLAPLMGWYQRRAARR